MVNKSVIIEAKRTPIGSFQGQLSMFSSPELAAKVIESIFTTVNLRDFKPDEIILGNVLTGGLGQAPARQAAIYGGCSKSIEALTINKMCGSGLKAVMLADQTIRSEYAEFYHQKKGNREQYNKILKEVLNSDINQFPEIMNDNYFSKIYARRLLEKESLLFE